MVRYRNRYRKRAVGLGLLALTLSLPAALPSGSAKAAEAAVSLVLDGRPLSTDVSPYIVPGANVTMVPIRVVSEKLGAAVAWTSASRTATISRGGVTISLTEGQSYALVGSGQVKLDATVQVRGGRVLVPLRFVGESLGVQVDWNRSTRTVTLTTATGQANGGADSGTAEEAELRSAWISTVYNLDWPSKQGLDAAQQQAEYIQLLDDLQAIGINAVFVQVRPAADALYPSSLVPWSQFLTGKQGEDPGYDPLAFMIEETHKRGMRFEAWFNPFRAALSASTAGLAANHVMVAHPDWIVTVPSSSGQSATAYIDPGIPAARQHVIDAILEVVNGYDIDGVHLDDYFYPSSGTFADDKSYTLYNDGGFASKADWRRDNINRFVRQLGESIHQAKPDVSFGISPFGVWRNQTKDPTGSATTASVTAYDDMSADVRTWIREDWIDYVVPQIYWSLSFTSARYDVLADWWANEVKGTDVKLYIGHAAYKLGTADDWQSAGELIDQLEYNKKDPEIQGDVFFSAKDLLKNPLGLIPELQSYYGK